MCGGGLEGEATSPSGPRGGVRHHRCGRGLGARHLRRQLPGEERRRCGPRPQADRTPPEGGLPVQLPGENLRCQLTTVSVCGLDGSEGWIRVPFTALPTRSLSFLPRDRSTIPAISFGGKWGLPTSLWVPPAYCETPGEETRHNKEGQAGCLQERRRCPRPPKGRSHPARRGLPVRPPGEPAFRTRNPLSLATTLCAGMGAVPGNGEPVVAFFPTRSFSFRLRGRSTIRDP